MPLHQVLAYLLVACILIAVILIIGKWMNSGFNSDDGPPIGCLIFVLLIVAILVALIFGL